MPRTKSSDGTYVMTVRGGEIAVRRFDLEEILPVIPIVRRARRTKAEMDEVVATVKVRKPRKKRNGAQLDLATSGA